MLGITSGGRRTSATRAAVAGLLALAACTQVGWAAPPPKQPSIGINDVSVQEGNSGTTPATFTVSLSQTSAQTVTVDYQTVEETATAGSDYSLVSGTLVFAKGTKTKTFSVAVKGDTVVEPDEHFAIRLSNAKNAIIAPGTGEGTIVNDDAPPPPPPVLHELTVTIDGSLTGKVTSTPAGIDCGSDCRESYAAGTEVTLTATPDAGSSFGDWDGCVSDTPTCTVTMTEARNVRAIFLGPDGTTNPAPPTPPPPMHALTVAKTGSGDGTVASAPAGINCGSDCSESYVAGTSVTLTATPASGSTFTGWSGACAGTATCTVTMNAVTSVTARFTAAGATMRTLTVTAVTGLAGGAGTVTSDPAGITCSVPSKPLQQCTATFADDGTAVLLTATPNGTFSCFAGWGGDTDDGIVFMNADKNVRATFGTAFGVGALCI